MNHKQEKIMKLRFFSNKRVFSYRQPQNCLAELYAPVGCWGNFNLGNYSFIISQKGRGTGSLFECKSLLSIPSNLLISIKYNKYISL